jgi:hypothetical protein
MNYFTNEKFADNTAYCDYIEYCRSIWNELPDELKSIQKNMVLDEMLDGLVMIEFHDGKIVDFRQDGEDLCIELNTNLHGALRKVWLKYHNATIIMLPKSNVLGEDIDNCKSDIMCHEIETIDTKAYTHTLLFASGEELLIQFKDISLKFKDFYAS